MSLRVLLTVLALVTLPAFAQPAAAAPPGPRLAVVELAAPERTELFTVDALGAAKSTLYAASTRRVPAIYPFSSPSWSPDGSRLAFTALAGQINTKFSSFPRTALALISQDGGPVEPIAGTAGGSDAVFSPNGTQVAFAKALRRWKANDDGGGDLVYESVSIWLADLPSGTSRQLTPWRNHLSQLPSSFSPDGSRLAFTRSIAAKPPEALEMEFNGSADSVLARNALEPVYSPDGSQIAFLRGPVRRKVERSKTSSSSTVSVRWAQFTDLYVRSANGGGLQRLTNTKDAAELIPRWDPSGQRLVYTRIEPFKTEFLLGFGDEIVEINADGTCETKVMSKQASVLFAAAWQPGPGREAGPISC